MMMRTSTLRKIGMVAAITLAGYGSVSLARDVYQYLNQNVGVENRETYALFVNYCTPEVSRCNGSVVPSIIGLRRSRDARLLWSADIAPYLQTNIPSIERVWQDDELSDILNGKLRLDFNGEPSEPHYLK